MIFTESEVIELKSEVVSDLCKEVIAFANTKGGRYPVNPFIIQ